MKRGGGTKGGLGVVSRSQTLTREGLATRD